MNHQSLHELLLTSRILRHDFCDVKNRIYIIIKKVVNLKDKNRNMRYETIVNKPTFHGQHSASERYTHTHTKKETRKKAAVACLLILSLY